MFEKILIAMNFAYTLLVLNYSAVGFMVSHIFVGMIIYSKANCLRQTLIIVFFHALQVLSLHETLTAYGSVYYIGTIVPILLILLSKVIKPPRPATSKARKAE